MINIEVLKNKDKVLWLKAEHEYYLYVDSVLVCYIDRLNDVQMLNHSKHNIGTAKHISKFMSNFKREEKNENK